MAYLRGMGDDSPAAPAPAPPAVTLEQLAKKQDAMMLQLRESENARKLGSYIAMGSALFAAFRLGILALPTIREKVRKRRAAGELPPAAEAPAVSNPRRRRRRRMVQ